ncbi:GAF and ANTAR domain-containing protein [Nocardioides sp. SYSU DS0651]|uniref:GAF and ANTAR domain-containing protein n=1 Tax=Nocardioides sp. SYSU DS0651 TaxID=3415955 RepID=UPI003F4BBF3D
MDARGHAAEALTDAARTIHAPRSVEDTLSAIVRAAVETVPGFDDVGISVAHPDGEIETLAGTGLLVWELDDWQYKLGEGPCYDAIRGAGVRLMHDADAEERWPNYLAKARTKGLRSQMGLQLYTDDGTVGGLNFYSTSRTGIDEDAVELAELFATHAAIALGRARHEDDLNQSVVSRQVIGTAVGIVMERHQLGEARAFEFLVRAATTSDVTLRAVAEEVVRSTGGR